MKRFLCILLAVLLAVPLFAAASEEEKIIDFEDQLNPGFYKSGACRYAVEEGNASSGVFSLHVTERTGEGAGTVEIRPASLNIRSGDTVRVSFSCYQTSGHEGVVSFVFSTRKEEPLFSGTVPSGVWTCVSGEFTLNENANLRVLTDASLYGQDP